MDRRVFDASFNRMALDLSYARGSVKEVADELGIDPGRLSKWRQKDSSMAIRFPEGLTDEQKEIKRLQKELKEAQLERDMDPMLTHVCGSRNAVSVLYRA